MKVVGETSFHFLHDPSRKTIEMLDSNWDWWFGDGPTVRRWMQRVISSKSWLRWTNVMRWMRGVEPARRTLVLGVCGLLGASVNPLHADEPLQLSEPEVQVASLPSGFFAAAGFAMIDDDAVAESANDAADVATDADEARRQRLRDLLRSEAEDDREQQQDSNDKDRMSLRDEIIADAAEDQDQDGIFSQPFITERLPDVANGRIALPSLQAVSLDTSTIGNGRSPDDFDADRELQTIPLPEEPYARGMIAAGTVLPWAAPNTYSHPLYFEDRMLERHGHERWGCLQPIASGARFFTTIPMLPYLATIQEPCDIVYSKGYFRAGSSAPCVMQRPPLERRAVVVEAAAIAGGMIALP